MDIKKIDKIIKEYAKNKYAVHTKFSKSSNSFYVRLTNTNGDSIHLRFSDHLNRKGIGDTFIYRGEKRKTEKQLKQYIEKKISIIEQVSLHKAFNKIEGREETYVPKTKTRIK